MALVVKRIELTDGIPDIPISDSYEGAMLIVTYRGRPIGDLCVKDNTDVISSESLRKQIAQRLGHALTTAWAEEELTPSMDRADHKPPPPVDVIVITGGGRPDDLERCLRSITDNSYGNKNIILVDNGDDNQKVLDVAQRFNAVYVREKIRGADFARNAGIRASTAPYVLLTDDDVVVDRLWIETAVKLFESDGTIACIAGLILPLELETEAQILFDVTLGGMKRGYKRRIVTRLDWPCLAAPGLGASANVAFRSAIFKTVGLFDEAMDGGTATKAGGDGEMFYRLLMFGYKVCYEPAMMVQHRHRKEMNELRDQLSGYALSLYAMLTKCIVDYHDFTALSAGHFCFRQYYLKSLLSSLIGRGDKPLRFAISDIIAIPRGVPGYIKAKAHVRRLRLKQGAERRGKQGKEQPSSLLCSVYATLPRFRPDKRRARIAQHYRPNP